jgi:MFS family permease
MGLGLGLTFVPTASIAVHHFKRRRALATGVVLSGGAFGSVIFPISECSLSPGCIPLISVLIFLFSSAQVSHSQHTSLSP